MSLVTKTYKRRPFYVEAVQVTKDNIAEIAPLIGSLEEKGDGTPFILVDRKRLPNIHRVYPGYWMTRMDGKIRCYSGRIFDEQFEPAFPNTNPFQGVIDFNEQKEGLLD